eukprot:TRINITY_DN12715_c0_g4_i1.p1 TRINITY_DN12715_c0_g4~~TRINITY_DN12715_c0_g4_i1.p1  ORF type:complete len:338 (+),score=66.57 TRINITY_DN12715_c0_g4_i1:60-1016(+)
MTLYLDAALHAMQPVPANSAMEPVSSSISMQPVSSTNSFISADQSQYAESSASSPLAWSPPGSMCLVSNRLATSPLSCISEEKPSQPSFAAEHRVQELEELLQQMDAEARELRTVISTKDGIIRTLGAQLGAAERAAEVVSTKDSVIRELGFELGATKMQMLQNAASNDNDDDHFYTHSAAHAPAHTAAVRDAPKQLFTVAPVGNEEAEQISTDSEVDRRIVAFTNSRRSRVLFTRLENEEDGFYLFGRLLVWCEADDSEERAGVLVHDARSGHVFTLEKFVDFSEATEHAYFEQIYRKLFPADFGGSARSLTEPIAA